MILLGPSVFWDSKQLTHSTEWKSANIDRVPNLAAGANGASLAYDRSMYVRALCAELETPLRDMPHMVLVRYGRQLATRCPFALARIASLSMILVSTPLALLRISELRLT